MCLNFHAFVRFFNSFVDLSKKTWSKLTEKCNSKKEHLLKTLSEASFLFRNQLYPENCHEFIFSKNTIISKSIASFMAFPSFKPNTSKKLPFWCIIKFMLTLGEIWGQNWYNVDLESPSVFITKLQIIWASAKQTFILCMQYLASANFIKYNTFNIQF